MCVLRPTVQGLEQSRPLQILVVIYDTNIRRAVWPPIFQSAYKLAPKDRVEKKRRASRMHHTSILRKSVSNIVDFYYTR